MLIFHLVPNLNYGGLQEVVRGLALCQRQAGHSVTIGCWTNKGNHPEAERDLERAGVRIVYLRRAADGKLLYGKRFLFHKLKECLGKGNSDILHVHNPFDYYLYGAIAARVAGGTAIVYTLHATVMFERAATKAAGIRRIKAERIKALFWLAAMLTDGLVSVCAEAETYLRKHFLLPGKRLSVVENGIDMTPFLAVPARYPRDQVVFGAVGRLSFEKNHRLLIEAFALARRKHANIWLRLLGGGPLEPILKQQARSLGVADAVEFCGFSHNVAGFLGALDVFVLPSISEALPLTLLEAIASGLPVIASAVGGIPRVVQTTDSGWLFAPGDVNHLQAAMETAIVSSDRRERGERARQLVAEKYSAERMARDYEQVYRTFLR
jgi:glycosyltransferase involved in cell wall biosynthesis